MNIEKIKARAEAATAETNVFYRINSLTPEDLEHSLNEDGYNTCLLKLMAHALFDIPALLDALEVKERECESNRKRYENSNHENVKLREQLAAAKEKICLECSEDGNGCCDNCEWRKILTNH